MIIDQFDKTKPFYGYVYQYFVNYYGSIILWNKYFFKKFTKIAPPNKSIEEWEQFLSRIGLKESEKEYLKIGIPEYPMILFPANLQNSFNKDSILINDDTMLERLGDVDSRLNAVSKMSNMVVVMAFEILPSYVRYNNEELCNFLYHCRNAAAHGGVFNIKNEKRFPAKWKGLSIKPSSNGLNLVVDSKGIGFLRPMDIILLLLDIEKKYSKHL